MNILSKKVLKRAAVFAVIIAAVIFGIIKHTQAQTTPQQISENKQTEIAQAILPGCDPRYADRGQSENGITINHCRSGEVSSSYVLTDSKSGEILSDELPHFYANIYFVKNISVIPFYKNNKFGFIERKNGSYNIIIEPKFDDIQPYYEEIDFIAVRICEGWNDIRGDSWIPSEQPLKICESGKWGYIDKTGKYTIEPKYLYAKNFENNIAIVKIDEQNWAQIDKKGNILLKMSADYMEYPSEGMVPFYVKGPDFDKCKGTHSAFGVKPDEYSDEKYYRRGYYTCKEKEKNVEDKEFYWVWYVPQDVSEGDVIIHDYRLGFADTKGNIIIKPQLSVASLDFCGSGDSLLRYYNTPYFKNGYCLIGSPDGIGVINKKGEWVIKPSQDESTICNSILTKYNKLAKIYQYAED